MNKELYLGIALAGLINTAIGCTSASATNEKVQNIDKPSKKITYIEEGNINIRIDRVNDYYFIVSDIGNPDHFAGSRNVGKGVAYMREHGCTINAIYPLAASSISVEVRNYDCLRELE